jgi:hypothetical protein
MLITTGTEHVWESLSLQTCAVLWFIMLVGPVDASLYYSICTRVWTYFKGLFKELICRFNKIYIFS